MFRLAFGKSGEPVTASQVMKMSQTTVIIVIFLTGAFTVKAYFMTNLHMLAVSRLTVSQLTADFANTSPFVGR